MTICSFYRWGNNSRCVDCISKVIPPHPAAALLEKEHTLYNESDKGRIRTAPARGSIGR